MGFPTPHTFASGEVITAANLNTFGSGLSWLAGGSAGLKPVFRAHQATAQSIPNAAWTTVTLDTVDEDTDSGWTAGTNTYTVKTAGVWIWGLAIGFAANGTGWRGGYLNGLTANATWHSAAEPSNFGSFSQAWPAVRLAAGATVIFQAQQTSGGALNTLPGGNTGVMLTGVLVGL